ncbi:hypothetical protein [Sulfitobacter donghicola]|uniref:Uncharacterized protein n=1 Tax=Sulfitobacter donghicola DSW-25 = KCTC 12864 = JCM 14565 TaxID=1300350 RepID=A0A073IL80_9RHOB|nr:hypothetical protein [Sulfitobacter donghicola]KEJ91053.1 hypothetical protein DSW25_01105 [Sulfitobacter donghicola DSW-25 = KCTC 12864 = JCM 14565]KIN67788.1 hypothetical protein Z948_1510 [Sulfitobacter donghicola DSW-25 = KCTC 12864 = JCM 14565]
MKNIWLLVLYCSFWGTFVEAKQLPLRSGDHPTFSRITLPVPLEQKWAGKQTDQGIELELLEYNGGFDISDVFKRMLRLRISEIQANESRLILSLNCACSSTIFRSGDLLVIDVADKGTPLSGPPLERSNNPDQLQAIRPQVRAEATKVVLPWIKPKPLPNTLLDHNNLTQRQQLAETTDEGNIERAELLLEMQSELVKEFSQAATSGLLNHNQLPSIGQEEVGQIEPESSKADEPPLQLDTKTNNVRVSDSMDRQFNSEGTAFLNSIAGVECPADHTFEVENWGTEQSFSAQIGPARNALSNSRDKMNAEAAETLSKLYIYWGFGAEALAVLNLDSALKNKRPNLVALATILEHGTQIGGSSFTQHFECDSNVALWAALSVPEIPQNILFDTESALLALNRLPSHLRKVLAPALSTKLLEYGDKSGAEAAIRSIERITDKLDAPARLAQAHLATAAGTPSAPLLEEVIETNSPQSAEALVKLVKEKQARDEPVSVETAKLVDAYAQELRGTELGNQLLETQIIALSKTNLFEKALEKFKVLSPSLSPKASQELYQTIVLQLTTNGSDIQFLEEVFNMEKRSLETLSTKAKYLVASRLMDLGFPLEVQKTLDNLTSLETSEHHSILLARAAIALNQPARAQAELKGITTPEAALLIAQTKEMRGEFLEASQIFAENNADAEAERAAWLSSEWDSLNTVISKPLASVATLSQTNLPTDSSALGPLSTANLAVEESNTARKALEQMLGEPSLQVPAD